MMTAHCPAAALLVLRPAELNQILGAPRRFRARWRFRHLSVWWIGLACVAKKRYQTYRMPPTEPKIITSTAFYPKHVHMTSRHCLKRRISH